MVSRYNILAAVTVIVAITSSSLLAADYSSLEKLQRERQDNQPKVSQQVIPEVSCQLNIKEKYQFYDIDGENVGELCKQMRENGTKWNDGKVYSALTTWDIHYGYDVTFAGGKCSVKSVKTDVDITYHLPRRISSCNGASLAAQWDDYLVHLKKHEFGHKDITVKSAGEINEILASLTNFSSQGELDREAKRRTDQKLDRLQQDQIGYDAETRHGETQGAILAAQ